MCAPHIANMKVSACPPMSWYVFILRTEVLCTMKNLWFQSWKDPVFRIQFNVPRDSAHVAHKPWNKVATAGKRGWDPLHGIAPW